MEKKIVEVPKFETIQTGVDVKEVWVTSDGRQFDYQKDAESHEFYHCKIRLRGIETLPVDNILIVDLENIGDLYKFEARYTYNEQLKEYDPSAFKFPNTFVYYERYTCEGCDSYDGSEYDTHLYCVTLEEYKKMLLECIENLS